MIYETIDLYKYCGISRNGNAGGYLRTYVADQVMVSGEIGPIRRPAMLVLPGGGYNMCSSREAEPIAIRFMDEGFSSFVLTYTCKKMYPTQMIEACMAMIYIRENAEKYYVDPDHVAAVGFSAGGHLAACLATLSQSPEVLKTFPGKADLLKLNAVVLSYAVITLMDNSELGTKTNASGNNPAMFEYLSLQTHVTKDTCPAFIWCTEDDNVVPSVNSKLMKEAYDKAGVKAELRIYEHGPHGLSLANEEVYNFNPEMKAKFPVIQGWTKEATRFLKSLGFEITNK